MGLLLASAAMIYIYQEYLGEDTDPNTENLSNPIINKRLNAVVLRITAAKTGNPPKIDVVYIDLDTKEAASVRVNNPYVQRIHIGDTLTKEKGEKLLLVYRKDGNVTTVPID